MSSFLSSINTSIEQLPIPMQRGLKPIAYFFVGAVGDILSREVVEMTFMKEAFLGGLNGLIFSLFDHIIGKMIHHPYLKTGGTVLAMEVLRKTPLFGRVFPLFPALNYGAIYLLAVIENVVAPFFSSIFKNASLVTSHDLSEVIISEKEKEQILSAIENQNALLVRELQKLNTSYAVSGSSLFCLVIIILAGLAEAKDQQKVIHKLGLQNMPIEKIYQGLSSILQEAVESKQPEIQINTAIVADKKQILPEFSALMRKFFKAEYLPHNKKEINAFVKQKTKGVIQQILNSEPNGDMLINVTCFKGLWENEFKFLGERPFYGIDGKETDVQFMKKQANMGFCEIEDPSFPFTIIEQAYQTKDLKKCSFVIFVPKRRKNINHLENKLEDEQFLKECFSKVHQSQKELILKMPKIDIRTEITMLKPLLEKEFGFKNFPALIKFDGNEIDEIIQKSRIQCDEKGTKAAAVTYLTTRGLCSLPSFTLDQPFIFFIRFEGMTLFRGAIKSQKGLLTSS